MKLEYETLITYSPIKLSIGTIRKPLLQDISDITFRVFYYYEFLMKLTVEDYYVEIVEDEEIKKQYSCLSDDEKEEIQIYDIIQNDVDLQQSFCELFNFYFIETVVFDNEHFDDGVFLILKELSDVDESHDIIGVITRETFKDILEVLQQLCYIYNEEEDISKLKFKNSIAKKLYLRELNAKKEAAKRSKNRDATLPNIISAINARHHSLNFTNIYQLTVFQLIDCFQRMKTNIIYDITSRGVSVWGDEKKTFDFSLWYKNYFDSEN